MQMQPPTPYGSHYQPAPKSKLPLILGLLLGLPALALFGLCGYIGAVGPEIEAQPGHAVAARHKAALQELGLIEPAEQIEWLYSDAAFSVDEGVYFFTAERLVLHASSWDPPTIEIELGAITDIDMQRDTSFLTDSTVIVQTNTGDSVVFPLSSEAGKDRMFLQALEEKVAAAGGTLDSE
jgi:hypothetical protein